MKIAICAQGELFGGVERHIIDLVRFLVRRGLPAPQVMLFHDRELAARLRTAGLEPVILRGRHRYDPALVARVRGLLDGGGAEVVHVHGYKATAICGLARRGRHWGLVKTEHGKLEARPRRPLDWAKSQFNFALEQYLTRRHTDHVCYVTEDIADFFRSRHGGLARTVVHNGIDPLDRREFERPAELSAATWNAGIVGRIAPVKGIPVAIRALTHPAVAPDTALHILGTGPLEDELERLAARLGVGDRVHRHGFRDDVYAWLAHLDVLLMPSYHEGLPYTLLEAWTLNCPIVASRVGGLAEVLPESAGTRLVAAGAVDELAAALTAVRRAAGDRRPPLPNCPLTLDAMGSAYLEIYRDVAEPAASILATEGAE